MATSNKPTQTFHIHLTGLVQGVGFRPYVYKLATASKICGEVFNTTDGVHVFFNASKQKANAFYKQIFTHIPAHAILKHHTLSVSKTSKKYTHFSISKSPDSLSTDLLLTPDIGICLECLRELRDYRDKRHNYAFTTCLHCGPRYSIVQKLPYDRPHTTMAHLAMCPSCKEEYINPLNRRHFSQTNSCPTCSVPMALFGSNQQIVSSNWNQISTHLLIALNQGKTIAVKGIGGYLLLCDATNEKAIGELRLRKHRPAKPFAVLFNTIAQAKEEVEINAVEEKALSGAAAPIVLCKQKSNSKSKLCNNLIAPGLAKIGVLMPYSPLLYLLAEAFTKPLIATSANLSGAPIIYRDKDAIDNLFDMAEYVLSYDREIVAPQDDSLIQFANKQQLILRRSRGLAPNHFPNPFAELKPTVLAMGSELKSTFALAYPNNLLVSQFLGDLQSLESQEAFKHTLEHTCNLVKAKPQVILVDKHPGYFASEYGKELAAKNKLQLLEIQHHKAHFAAVLLENKLQNSKKKILGFIWDGTGYGDDGQIWGGETFTFSKGIITRTAQLAYFPQLLGDKMTREPRLSALSMLSMIPEKTSILEPLFSKQEWQLYTSMLAQKPSLFCSSMGRLLDAVAAILGVCTIHQYEGQATMMLETLATSHPKKCTASYSVKFSEENINWIPFLQELIFDIEKKLAKEYLACKVFNTLVKMIELVSTNLNINQLAFSGGVFQNAYLVNAIQKKLSKTKQLYFNTQLSANDENISFGQLAYYSLQTPIEPKKNNSTFTF
ncbi:MAG: carbamoyltransferase HypF [Bacteroidetes bacterium B1(2017)]|nr:MAG: carbamoyltransferase HypF [Bacteroidetes bacterium B1(2017)]